MTDAAESTATSSSSRGRRLLIALAIVAAAILAYLPSLPGEFIWDDDAHVTQNRVLTDEGGLQQIWVPDFDPIYKPHTPQYYPLTFSALWVQYRIFERDPFGYHLVNLALHIANALLVWAVFARLRMRGAWLVGALFALHPMHVETTAWVMELKNLMSGFFYLTAALSYFSFDERYAKSSGKERRGSPWGWYALALGLFVCALLSKSITATLPAALILALLFKRRRLTPRRLAPLVPFFVIGISLALNTAFLEHNHVGAKGVQFDFTIADKLLISSRVLLFYPFKLIVAWPQLFNYPRWNIDPSSILDWWPALLVIGIAGVAVVAYRRGKRGPALALAYFAGTVFPALGLITYYPMIFSFVADHFCYLPSIGILALIAGAAATIPKSATARAVTGGLLMALFGGLTTMRSAEFASAESLYRQNMAHNPDAWLVRALLATRIMEADPHAPPRREGGPNAADMDEAEQLLLGAIELKHDHAILHFNLGSCLYRQGRHEEAHECFENFLALDEDQPEGHAMFAVTSLFLEDPDSAERSARRALEGDDRNSRALMVLGDIAVARGEPQRAIPFFRDAVIGRSDVEIRRLSMRRLFGVLMKSSPEQVLTTLEELRAGGRRASIGLQQLRAQALFRQGQLAGAFGLLDTLLVRARTEGQPEEIQAVEAQISELRRQSRKSP